MKPIVKRTYRSAQMLKNIIMRKGYTETESWSIVQKIFDSTADGADLRRCADMVITKQEWLAMC